MAENINSKQQPAPKADTKALAAARAARKQATSDPKGGSEKGSPKGQYSHPTKNAHRDATRRDGSKPKPQSGVSNKVDGGTLGG